MPNIKDLAREAKDKRAREELAAIKRPDELTRLRSDLARMTLERDQLQAIVDKLPKTADGVPMVPGYDQVYLAMRGDDGTLHSLSKTAATWRLLDLRAKDCYSTREAAEAAKEPSE
jgi:hypothetical protein